MPPPSIGPPTPSAASAIAAGDALHARVRRAIAHVAAGGHDLPGDAPFEELARALATHQARFIPGYARLCASRGVDPATDPLEALPAVPTDAFRVARVATYPAEHDAVTFRTSGTTLAGRGAHSMRTLATYHAAAMAWARRTLFRDFVDVGRRPRIIAIAATPSEAPDSSLSRMLDWFVGELGDDGSRMVRPDDTRAGLDALSEAVRAAGPVVVLATAFAYVHVLDRLDGAALCLPSGSRAMQTGGFKGRSREIAPADLRAGIARAFGIDAREVVGEYGMTELASQLYAMGDEGVAKGPAASGEAGAWVYRAPPWVRVIACDPVTLTARATGECGIARIEDLANVESAWAIQTADEVCVRRDGGVVLYGRMAGAAPRGCSIAVEEMGDR